MAKIDELVKMNQSDIIETIPTLGDEERLELAKAELAREKPRSGVLSALGVNRESVSEESAAKIVETVDMHAPFSMVWHNDGKHYFQNGKVYDAVTKEVIHPVPVAAPEKATAKK